MAHKFNFIKGGADKYFLDLANLLSSRGVAVAKFVMRHPHNLPDHYSQYWPSGINLDRFSFRNIGRYATHIFWNFEAAKNFNRLLDDFRPDIVHVHNIYHHLSPSILPAAKKRGIPVVMHLHDYKLVCPNYKMFSNGRIDESAKGGRYWSCVWRRCFKNSYWKSLVVALEMWLHHKILRVYEKNIDLYIAPSIFVKNKMAEWGVPADKIEVLHHFVGADQADSRASLGDYFLYFGRLDKEKGVDVLLRAMVNVQSRGSLKIVGFGPEHKNLKALARSLSLSDRVEFVGPKYGEELKKIIAGAYAVVVPSQWYEVFGLVNLEAAALGKLVIAAAIGGIPEAVKDSQTALLFNPENIKELTTKLNWSLDHPQAVATAGQEAREFILRRFSAERHWRHLLNIYQRLSDH